MKNHPLLRLSGERLKWAWLWLRLGALVAGIAFLVGMSKTKAICPDSFVVANTAATLHVCDGGSFDLELSGFDTIGVVELYFHYSNGIRDSVTVVSGDTLATPDTVMIGHSLSAGSYFLYLDSVKICGTALIGLRDSLAIHVHGILGPPTVSASGNTTFCDGDSVTLLASGTVGYLWFPSGDTSASITVDSSGLYVVYAVDSGCISAVGDSMSVTVNLIPQPPIITPNGLVTFCNGDSVILRSSYNFGNQWNTGDISDSIIVVNSGNYSLYVVEMGCTSTTVTVTVTEIILSPPIISANDTTQFCTGDSVILSSNTINGNQWSTGSNNTHITVRTSGTYWAYRVYQNCSSAASQVIQVVVDSIPPTPFISWMGAVTFCEGGSVILSSNNATGNHWIPTGDTTQSITVDTTGTFSVFSVNVNCISDTSNSVFTVSNPNPIPSLGADSMVCPGSIVTLNAGLHFDQYLWNIGDTTPSIVVVSPGTYSVQVIDSNQCTGFDTITIGNYIPPTVHILGVDSICKGSPTTLRAQGGLTYTWNTGATTDSITVIPANDTTYWVIGFNIVGCPDSTTHLLKVNESPSPIILGDTVICLGDTNILTADASPLANLLYQWSLGSTTNNQAVTVGTTVYVTVTTNDALQCTGQDSVSTFVFDSSAWIQSPDSVCPGDFFSIAANTHQPGYYHWSTGHVVDSFTTSLFNTQVFTVTVTFGNACDAVASKNVAVFPQITNPTVIFGEDTLCRNSYAMLYAYSPALSGWNYVLGMSTGLSPVYMFPPTGVSIEVENWASAGEHQIWVTMEDPVARTCLDRDTIFKEVYVRSVQAWDTVNVIQFGPSILTCTNGGFVSYQWGYDDGMGSHVINGATGQQLTTSQYNFIANLQNHYWVLTVDPNGCQTRHYWNPPPIGIPSLHDLIMEWEFYPNPSNGSVSLAVENAYRGIVRVWVADLAGKVVALQYFRKVGTQFNAALDLLHLSNGLYSLSIEMGKIQSQKLVIHR